VFHIGVGGGEKRKRAFCTKKRGQLVEKNQKQQGSTEGKVKVCWSMRGQSPIRGGNCQESTLKKKKEVKGIGKFSEKKGELEERNTGKSSTASSK